MLPNLAYKQTWFVLYTSPSPEGFWGPKAVLLDTLYKSKFKAHKGCKSRWQAWKFVVWLFRTPSTQQGPRPGPDFWVPTEHCCGLTGYFREMQVPTLTTPNGLRWLSESCIKGLGVCQAAGQGTRGLGQEKVRRLRTKPACPALPWLRSPWYSCYAVLPGESQARTSTSRVGRYTVGGRPLSCGHIPSPFQQAPSAGP